MNTRNSIRTGARRAFFTALVCLISAQAAHAAVITVSTAVNTVGGTDFATATWRVGDLSGAMGDSLSAFDVDIIYDASILGFDSVSFTDPVLGNQLDLPDSGSFGFFGEALDLGGVADVYAFSGNLETVLDADQQNAFDFLSITFEVLDAALLAGAEVSIDLDDDFLQFVDSGFGELPITDFANVATFSPTVPVPEPETLFLMLAGLAGLASARIRH